MNNCFRHRLINQTISRSGLFDRAYYLRSHLEVARDCVDPVQHYIRCGWRQGNNPNPYFDTAWYLEAYPEVSPSRVNPLYHYLSFGWKQGYDPSPSFSAGDYLQRHPAVAQAGGEPLSHFLQEMRKNFAVADFSNISSEKGNTECFGKVAIHAHIYYADLMPEFVDFINHVPEPFDCVFTTDTQEKKEAIEKIAGHDLHAARFEVRIVPNIGRDIAPFAVGCRDLLEKYDVVCHIHTKKALHTSQNNYGNTWRRDVLTRLLGSQRQVRAILNYFNENDDVGLLCPKNFIPIQKYLESDINQWNMRYLAERLGLKAGTPPEIVCPAGSMFWARTHALRNLVDGDFSYLEFNEEVGQLDGTLAHAFERMFGYVASDNGFSSRVIDSTLN